MIRKKLKKPLSNLTPSKLNGVSPLYDHYNITPQESVFISEYVKEWDELKALKEAGLYPQYKTTLKAARQEAYALLKKPAIVAALQKAVEYRTQRNLLSNDQLISHIAKIAYADPSDLYDSQGYIKNVPDMPYELRCAITEIKQFPIYKKGETKDDPPVFVGFRTTVKLESKLNALKELSKQLNPKQIVNLIDNHTENTINFSHLDKEKTDLLLSLLVGGETPDPKIIELEKLETCNLEEK